MTEQQPQQQQATTSPAGTKGPPVEIKLFVGRVPRTINEDVLKPLFAQHGEIVDMTVIRDRESGAHKGCAFVRMKSITQADSAIRALNNIKVLDTNLGPLTVKYAQGETERLGLPSDSAAAGVDQAKLFVGSLPKTATEDDIRAVFSGFGTIDEVFIMKDENKNSKGCAFVKFAFKEEAFWAINSLNGKYTMPGAPRPIEVRFAQNKKAQQSAAAGTPAGAGKTPGQSHPWTEYFTAEGRPYYYNSLTGQTQWERPAEMDAGAAASAAGRQTHGPPGANIFIFHVPNEWTENDLMQHFVHYGQIVSARIATDKETSRNRGFGFVSFDNTTSALNAVQGMNGFSVADGGAGKRLKVQIKKGEEQYTPAQGPGQGGMAMGMGLNAMGGMVPGAQPAGGSYGFGYGQAR